MHETLQLLCISDMRMSGKIYVMHYMSPCGELVLGSYGGSLCLCDWAEGRHTGRTAARLREILDAEFEVQASEITEAAAGELDEYFAGKRKGFGIPLMPAGTDFQKSVWDCLMTIPYGTTASYADIAAMIGRRSAVRAVANANGANPISVFIPCHRIIGSDGTLTGYGGGIGAKRFLLALEAGQELLPGGHLFSGIF